MGWMHDTLKYFSKEPIHRRWHQNDLTFGMLYQYAERFVSVFSHDEVVHGKASMLYKMGAWHIPEKAANLRALYTHMWAYPGKEAALHGQRVRPGAGMEPRREPRLAPLPVHGPRGDAPARGDLNRLYASEPVLGSNDFNPHGFRWISCLDADANLIAYLRSDPTEETLFVVVGHFGGPQGR
jgi:1,4-alpha-glucan branching enzyme